jgi:hypothetical protein
VKVDRPQRIGLLQKGGIRVESEVVIIRWHQAWRVERKKGRGKKNRQKTNTTALNLTHLLKKRRRDVSGAGLLIYRHSIAQLPRNNWALARGWQTGRLH